MFKVDGAYLYLHYWNRVQEFDLMAPGLKQHNLLVRNIVKNLYSLKDNLVFLKVTYQNTKAKKYEGDL